MLNIKTLSILALAGSALAAPSGWGNWGSDYLKGGQGKPDTTNNVDNTDNSDKGNYVTDVEVVTAYTTVTAKGNWHWGGNNNNNNNNNQASSTAVATTAPAMQTWAPVASQPAASQPAASPAPVAASSGGYMDIVSEWRSKMGMSALTEDAKLVDNADKTVTDSNGKMVHELNPGSFGQVLAPGKPSEFEKVFVGGWLCEMPTLPGLNGICSTMSDGWAYDGQTGHAEILSSSKYTKIGCACKTGIWACDLA